MTGCGELAALRESAGTVERIAVLRPSALGDYVFALPALAALRATWPRAPSTVLGRRWHCDFLADRPGPVDEVIELPPVPGVGAAIEAETRVGAGAIAGAGTGEAGADAIADAARIESCVQRLRERRFDLALQMYGGGGHANPFVLRLGARLAVGMRAPGAPPLDRDLEYRPWQNERLRLLEVVGLVGAAPAELAPRLALTARDIAELDSHVQLPDAPLVVLQPGATDSRRRWSAQRFAAVGDALAARGAVVAINGSAAECELTATVAEAMVSPAFDLGGVLSLSGLAALLARAALVVSNDTGPLHLAQALGSRSVGIYWFLNLLASAPLTAARHRHAFSTRTQCPVCGAENLSSRCAHDASFVDDVPLDAVLACALAAFDEARDEAMARVAV